MFYIHLSDDNIKCENNKYEIIKYVNGLKNLCEVKIFRVIFSIYIDNISIKTYSTLNFSNIPA